MTALNDLERRLATWLAEDGPASVHADVVDAALAKAARTRQGPAWLVPEWWRPRRPRPAEPTGTVIDVLDQPQRVLALPVIGPRPRLAWVIIVLAALIALLGGLLGAGGWLRATTTPAACPAGTDPDAPGPVAQARPVADYGPVAEWAGDTSILARPLTGSGPTWTFDVCSNTWLASEPDALAAGGDLVWDAGSSLLVAVGYAGSSTRRPGEEWVHHGGPQREAGQAGYDPAADLVLVRDPYTGSMWTYDPDTNAWREIAQVGPTPPGQANHAFVLATYDAAAGRFVLLDGAQTRRVWLFDPRASSWTVGSTLPPDLELFIQTDELAYDPVGGRSLVFANGRVFAYDARVDTWEILSEAGLTNARYHRVASGVAFDRVNERLVVMGGRVPTNAGWVPTDDVVAFDPRARTWIELLAPTWRGSR